MVGFYILTAIVLVILMKLGVWFLSKNFGYWESQGIAVVKKPRVLFGTSTFFNAKPIHILDFEAYKKLGKIFGLYDGRRPALVIADPDLIKRVFVEDFHTFPYKEYSIYKNTNPMVNHCITNLTENEWRKVHRALVQMFTYDKIKELLPCIESSAETFIKNLKDSTGHSKTGIDIYKFAVLYATSLVAKIVFGIEDDLFKGSEYHPFVKNARRLLEPSNLESWAYQHIPYLADLFAYRQKSVAYFVKLATTTLKERQQQSDSMRLDFLQFLLDAQEDEELLLQNPLGHLLHHYPKSFPDEMIIAHLVVFVFVAISPIASAVTFAAYAMAKNLDVQEIAAEEISKFILENEDIVDTTVLAKLQYTELVLAEVLRMYPPLVRNERICTKLYRLRTCRLTAGTSVIIPVYCIHHDSEYYPNPHVFDPNRFRDMPHRHRLTYLPFGLGPRKCIGKDLAMLETKMALVYLLQNFHVELTPQAKNLEYKTGSVYLKPANGVYLRLIERKKPQPKPAVFLLEKYLQIHKRRRLSSSTDTPPDMDFDRINQHSSSAVVVTRRISEEQGGSSSDFQTLSSMGSTDRQIVTETRKEDDEDEMWKRAKRKIKNE